jgi:DNA adenine methylase
MQATIKPVLKYPGSKNTIAPWIIRHFPPHVHYVEPFFGSSAVFFNKPPAKHEVINDLSGDVCNLFQVIRTHRQELIEQVALTPWARTEYDLSYQPCEEPIERARRFLVRVWQAHGGDLSTRVGWACGGVKQASNKRINLWKQLPDRIALVAQRLLDAEIENRPALDVIQRYSGRDVLIYADPPYPLSTRHGKLYQHEMTDADHIELLDALDKHPGPVVLSGYHCPLYDDRLAHWQTVEKRVQAEKGNLRTEVLWLNHAAQPIQSRMFDL